MQDCDKLILVINLEVGSMIPDKIPAFIEEQKEKLLGYFDDSVKVLYFAKRGDMKSDIQVIRPSRRIHRIDVGDAKPEEAKILLEAQKLKIPFSENVSNII